MYDASARSTGPSLNDCLYPTRHSFDSRHQESLLDDSCGRDVLRFLWFDDVFLDEPAIVELQFARVVFGVSSSPFLLNATVQHHLEEFLATHHETVTSILQSIMLSSEQKMKRVPISFIENRRRFWGRDHSI